MHVSIDEETRWDPDETKTKTRARRHVSGEIQSEKSLIGNTLTIPLLNRASVHELPLHNRSHSARSESLRTYFTADTATSTQFSSRKLNFVFWPGSISNHQERQTDLLSNHPIINLVSRISNFLNSSIDFPKACLPFGRENEISILCEDCGGIPCCVFGSYRWMKPVLDPENREEFVSWDACVHPLDWIEKYREIVPGDRYFLKSSYRDTCSKLYLFFFFFTSMAIHAQQKSKHFNT